MQIEAKLSRINLRLAAVRASTTALDSLADAMCIFCNFGQLLPRQSTKFVRSVVSFPWFENSMEISFKLGQFKTCRRRI